MTSSRTARAVLTLLVSALLALVAATPASAHDVVTGSDPADGSSLPTAPQRVSVTFNEAPQPGLSTLTVVGPDGARHEQGPTTTEGSAIAVGVGPLTAAGRYEIGYRVVSEDGHPVSGAVSFTLASAGPAQATAASAAPGAPQAPPSPAASSGPDDGGGVPAWPFVVLAVIVVAGAVLLVVRRRV